MSGFLRGSESGLGWFLPRFLGDYGVTFFVAGANSFPLPNPGPGPLISFANAGTFSEFPSDIGPPSGNFSRLNGDACGLLQFGAPGPSIFTFPNVASAMFYLTSFFFCWLKL